VVEEGHDVVGEGGPPLLHVLVVRVAVLTKVHGAALGVERVLPRLHRAQKMHNLDVLGESTTIVIKINAAN